MSAVTVEHCRKSMQFAIKLGGSLTAHLDYRPVPGKEGRVLDFHHTFVPKEAGGRGLAALLVQHGFQYARDSKQLVRPTCSYVAAFVQKPENAALKTLVESPEQQG